MSTARQLTMFAAQLIFAGIMLIIAFRVKKGKPWPVRRLAGIDALEDAMGRATEMNRPVSYMMGEGMLTGADGSQTVAALCILPYIARLAAKLDTPLFVQVTVPEIFNAVEEICRCAYTAEGKQEKWDPKYGLRISRANDPICVSYLWQENVSVNLMFGSIRLPSVTMAENANRLGAVSIAGTAAITNICFLVAACDYVILGDELFAAAAYISEDPVQISTINTTDLIKIGVVGLVIIGMLILPLGIDLAKIVYP